MHKLNDLNVYQKALRLTKNKEYNEIKSNVNEAIAMLDGIQKSLKR